MEAQIRQQDKQATQTQPDGLINRTQMLIIARQNNLFITKSTIHRWANEPGFPYPIGQDGRNLLYHKGEYAVFLKRKLHKLQMER